MKLEEAMANVPDDAIQETPLWWRSIYDSDGFNVHNIIWSSKRIVKEDIAPHITNHWRKQWDMLPCHEQRCKRVYSKLEPWGA